MRWVTEQMQRNGCLAIRDVEALPSDVRGLRRFPASPFRALLVVPMSDQEATTGWIVLDDVDRPHSWSDEDISTARLVAEIIAMGRARSEAEEKIRRQAARNELLSGVSRLFLNDDPEVATDAALGRLGAYFDAERASLFALDERRSRLRCTHRWIAPGRRHELRVARRLPGAGGGARRGGRREERRRRELERTGRRRAGSRGSSARRASATCTRSSGTAATSSGCSPCGKREGQGSNDDDAGILGIVGELIAALGRVRRAAEIALEKAKEDAVAASRTKSAFLANMSHELRTPLNGVIGMVDLLATTALDERQRRYAEIARTSARLLLSVISDILDFSKIEAGKLELESVEVGVDEIAREVASILRLSAEEKHLELAYHSSTGLDAPLLGDPSRLRQVTRQPRQQRDQVHPRGQGRHSSLGRGGVGRRGPRAIRGARRQERGDPPSTRRQKLFQAVHPGGRLDDARAAAGRGSSLAICREPDRAE